MKEVVHSYPIECRGADASLPEITEASITVFEDSSRQVGCPYINLMGECQVLDKGEQKQTSNIETHLNSRCVHLFPIDSAVDAN